MPTGKSFDDLAVNIRNDGQANIMSLFSDWHSLIYDDTGRGTTANQVSYKGDYATTINLTHFDMLGNQILQFTFIEAYPKNNSGINFNWDSTGMTSIPISFRYKKYTKSTASVNNSNLTGNQGIDPNTGIPVNSIYF